jgi:hypothetical protein
MFKLQRSFKCTFHLRIAHNIGTIINTFGIPYG